MTEKESPAILSPADTVDRIPVSVLLKKASPYNPRDLPKYRFDALVRSISRHGFVEPVIVNRRTDRMVGGHQRVKAARDLGMMVLPVIWVDLDENLSLNRIGDDAWNQEMLGEMLADLRKRGADLTATGFSKSEADKYIEDLRERMKGIDTGYSSEDSKFKNLEELRMLVPQGTRDRIIKWLERIAEENGIEEQGMAVKCGRSIVIACDDAGDGN